MDTAARLMVPVLVGLAGLIGALPGSPDEAENRTRLEAMPQGRRAALSEDLERFDKLTPAEQAAIRRLDLELAGLDPLDRARYREVLRRYHLWISGLTDDQKRRLEEAPGDEARFNLATQFRRAEMDKKPYPGPRISRIRTGEFGLIGPYEAAHLLRIWQNLSGPDRLNLGKRSGSPLHRDLHAKGRELGIAGPGPLASPDEARYDEVLDKDPDFKLLLGPYATRAAMKKAGDPAKKRFPVAYPVFLYFEEHPPIPVRAENLAKFSATCPDWLMSTLDPLSPDDARHYLTLVYRLLYPAPKEFEPPPDPKGKGSPAAPAPAKSGPRPPAAPKSQGPPP